jgi:hypothetical protein
MDLAHRGQRRKDAFRTGRYDTMTTQHAASSNAQSQTYRHRRGICVTEGGIVRDSSVLGYVCISDEINIKDVELVGETLHFV